MSLQLSLPPSGSARVRPFDLEAEAIPAWLAKLPNNDPFESARILVEELQRLNGTRMRATWRQDATELFLAQANLILPALDGKLARATLPFSTHSRSAAGLAEDLLAQLAYSYKLLLVEQGRRLFGFASSGRAMLPVVRAMQLLARRLAVGYRMYATNPKGVWSELHQLHHFAARRGLAAKALPRETETPASIYRNALLVAFADPLKLMAGDLDRLQSFLESFGDLATLSPAGQQKPGQGLFLVKPQRDLPGYALAKRHHPMPQSQDLVLNTLPLAEKLLDQLARLAADEDAAALGLPAAAADPAFRDLMGRLVKHWGAVPNRRFTRLRTHARVEISVGLRGIWDFLELHGKPAPVSGEWLVTNESPRGFALLYLSGPIEPIQVGEVVGIRTRDTQTCHICVVRWVLSDKPEHLELGLEEIAPAARPVSIRKTRDAADKPAEPVLLLPEVPSLNQAPALLASLAALDSTCELNLGELQSKLRVRATRLLERTVSVQVVQFSAVN